ncbi:MAG: hypothetical protein MJ252_04370 [archaeon]|nr:hypothetical protein [archaeon]
MDQNIQQGVPIEIMIKIKPEPNIRADLRIFENKISLQDNYDRPTDEFITNGAILDTPDAIRSTFESTIGKYLGFVVHGVNLTIFTFGSKSSGKTFCLNGSQNESGILPLLVENVFANLETKHAAIVDEMQKLSVPEMEATSYSYAVRMKYVEIRDESVIDLLGKYNYFKQPTQILYTEQNGYYVNGAAWVALSNSMAFPELLSEAERMKAPYEYNKVTKNSTMLVFEVSQTLENRATNDIKNIISKITVFDLPSADILGESFRNLSNSIEYRSIYAFQNMLSDLVKSNNYPIPTIYENSILTKLMKENIGGNSLCVGIFTLRNNDFVVSKITFNMMKFCSRIQNFPLLNDFNAIGLLKKFRTDIAYYQKFKYNNNVEINPPIIPPGQAENTIRPQIGPDQPLIPQNDPSNNARIIFLEKENARLTQNVAELEEERNNLLKTIANLRTRSLNGPESMGPMPMGTMPMGTMQPSMGFMPPTVMGDYGNVSDKLVHIEDDINEVNEIMGTVNKLNDKFKVLEEERKQLAEEVENLRQANQNLTNELNRNQQEGNTLKANSDNEIHNLKELLNSTKNELDYMRNEAEKYRKIQGDLLLEIDEREIQYKKQLEDKEREIEMKMANLSQNEKRRMEAEIREATRKVEHYGEENVELKKVIDEMKKEDNALRVANEALRKTLRDLLSKKSEGESDNKYSKLTMMKNYEDRENELMKNLEVEKSKIMNLKEQLRKMRTYARKARNLALDYFPANEEIPEILTKDLNAFLDDPENESVIQFLEYEIRALREKVKRMEYENTKMKEEFYNPTQRNIGGGPLSQSQPLNPGGSMVNFNNNGNPFEKNSDKLSEKEIQLKILEELNKLKTGNGSQITPGGVNFVGGNSNNLPTNPKEIMDLKSEIRRLSEENKNLKTLINENSVQDISDTKDINNPKAMKMKITFLEKTIEDLEREKSELNSKCTMFEEQLKNFQEMFNTSTQGYQKKILELNKRLEAANMKLNQNYGD